MLCVHVIDEGTNSAFLFIYLVHFFNALITNFEKTRRLRSHLGF